MMKTENRNQNAFHAITISYRHTKIPFIGGFSACLLRLFALLD
jgi:hypothetical protein